MAWDPGKKLNGGKYRIDRLLKKGPFATTYRALDEGDRAFTIKVLSDDLVSRLTPHQFLRRLFRPHELKKLEDKLWKESIKLEKCKHPNIVAYEDSFRENGRVCLVMHHVPGDNLKTLPRIWLEVEALQLIRQIGDALVYVHAKGLVHRDVKPENIVIRNNNTGDAVLIDFGLAKGSDSPTTTVNSKIPDGFSPLEMYNIDDDKGPYTDVYALAATLYFLLTKEIPPSAKERSLGTHLKSPTSINPHVSATTDAAIRKGMALLKDDRPQTMQAWLALLDGETRESDRPQKRRLPDWSFEQWMALLGFAIEIAIAIASLVVGILQLQQGNKPSEPIPEVTPEGDRPSAE